MTLLLKARSILARVPWQVWAVLGLAFVVWRGIDWHKDTVKDAAEAGVRAGHAMATQEFEEASRRLVAKTDAIVAALRKENDEKARTVAASADDLRVRGPGKAACPNPSRAAPTGGHYSAGGSASAPAAEVPAVEWGAVPWQWLVGQAEVCDLNRNEVLSWREWHSKLEASRTAGSTNSAK